MGKGTGRGSDACVSPMAHPSFRKTRTRVSKRRALKRAFFGERAGQATTFVLVLEAFYLVRMSCLCSLWLAILLDQFGQLFY